MTKIVAVCLGVLILWSTALGEVHPSGAFELANRVGEPNARTFFTFSTSAGGYVIRHDGVGEFTSPKGMRRVFKLKLGAKGRIERVYFLEHQGDVFLFYDVRDASSEWSYLIRMEQTKRKLRWMTAVATNGAPMMQGDAVVVDGTEIDKASGQILRQD